MIVKTKKTDNFFLIVGVLITFPMILMTSCAPVRPKTELPAPPVRTTTLLSTELAPDIDYQALSDATAKELPKHRARAAGLAPQFAATHDVPVLRDLTAMTRVFLYPDAESLHKHFGVDKHGWTGYVAVARTPLPGNETHIVLQAVADLNYYLYYWECARYLFTPDDYDSLSPEKKKLYDDISEAFADACLQAYKL